MSSNAMVERRPLDGIKGVPAAVSGLYFLDSLYVSYSNIKGCGIMTTKAIPANTLIFLYADIARYNKLLTWCDIQALPESQKKYYLTYACQIGDDLWAGPTEAIETPDISLYFNHSCAPNTYWHDPCTIVAWCDIAAGQELTFDYATVDSHESLPDMLCDCGAPNCRKKVSPGDWKLPELQKKYKGAFMPYLESKFG